MKASLRLEYIGFNTLAPKKPWVAEIQGFDVKHSFSRKFLNGEIDFSEANSKGSRGVWLFFLLSEDRIYQVSAFESWKSQQKYFCMAENGVIKKIAREEVVEMCIRQEKTRAQIDLQAPEVYKKTAFCADFIEVE